MDLERKLSNYYITAIMGVVFAVLGFSYNTWRLEVSEDNNNIRTAAFAVLNELAELEQIIYAAHYDKNTVAGSPRKAWVKVGLIVDLSSLINEAVSKQSLQLKDSWSARWVVVMNDREATDQLVVDINNVRAAIKAELKKLD